MAVEAAQDSLTNIMVASDADVGAGAPATMTGFPAGTLGYQTVATDPYGQYPLGTLILARNPAGVGSRLYEVTTNGSGTKVAVLIATASASSGGGGSIVGTPLLYVLAPAALGLTNAFTSFDTAIASIPNTIPAMLMIMPGTYTSTGVTLRGGLSIVGMTSPLYPDKDSGGTTFGGVMIDQGASSISIDSGALSVGSFYSFSNIQLNGSGVNIVHAGAQPLQFDNVSSSGTTFINKTGASGIKVGFCECYIPNPVVFTEPTSGGFRTTSIKARDSILGVVDPGATPTTGILGILCNDITATNCDLCGIDVVRTTEITGGRVFIEDGTNPCIFFRGQVPDLLSLTNVVLRTSSAATTYVGGIGGTVDLNGATFQRVSPTQTSLVSSAFQFVRSNNAPGGRIESFSSNDTASPTTSFVSVVSSMTLTIAEPRGITEDQRLIVYNRSGSGSATIDAAGAGTINGSATLSIGFGQYVQLSSDRINNNWLVVGGSSAFIGPITTALPDTVYVVGNNTPGGGPYNLSSVQYTTILAAVTAAAAAGGGTVQILPGGYAETFTLPNLVNLVGVTESAANVSNTGTITIPNAAVCGIANMLITNVEMDGASTLRVDNSFITSMTHGSTAGNTTIVARSTEFSSIFLDNATSLHDVRLQEGSLSGSITITGNVTLAQSNCSGAISTVGVGSVTLRDAEIVVGVTTPTLTAYNSHCATVSMTSATPVLNGYSSTFADITMTAASVGTINLHGCTTTSTVTTTLTGLRAEACNFGSSIDNDGTVVLVGCVITGSLEYGDPSILQGTSVGNIVTGNGSAEITGCRFGSTFTASGVTNIQSSSFASSLSVSGGILVDLTVQGATTLNGGSRIVGGDYIGLVTANEGFTCYIDNARLLSFDGKGVTTAVNTEFVNGITGSSSNDSHALAFMNCVFGGSITVSATAVSFSMRECVGTIFAPCVVTASAVEMYNTRFESSVTFTTASLAFEGSSVQGSLVIAYSGSALLMRSSHIEGAFGITATAGTVTLQDVASYTGGTLTSLGLSVTSMTSVGVINFATDGTVLVRSSTFADGPTFSGSTTTIRLIDNVFSTYTTVNGVDLTVRCCTFEQGGAFSPTGTLTSSNNAFYLTTVTYVAATINSTDDVFNDASNFSAVNGNYRNSTFGGTHTGIFTGDLVANACTFAVSSSFTFVHMTAIASSFLAAPTFIGTDSLLIGSTVIGQIAASSLGELYLRDTLVDANGFPASTSPVTIVSGVADAGGAYGGTVLSPAYSGRTAKNVDTVVAPGSVSYGNYLVKAIGSTPGDILYLPVSGSAHVWGYEIYIFNTGTTSIAVTPQGTDVINGSVTAVTLLPQEGKSFYLDPNIGWLSA